MTLRRLRSRVLAPVLLGLAGAAGAAEWRLDSTASRLEFQAYYQGDPVPGRFREFDAQLVFDPEQPAQGRLEVTVALASFDMGSREIHDAVRTPEWLDLGRFAQARFTSTDIRRLAGARYVAHGTLRLKGAARVVEVPFEWQPAGSGARLRGELTLDRGAFGIGTGEWADGDTIGREIRVRYDVRLVPER